jgi:hypothetical protein
MKIFLDDERNPTDWKHYDNSWVVVRSCDEFKKTILDAYHNVEEIEAISFDNDLGENEPEGYDCAKWLIDQYIVVPEILIHTMNPPAGLNIFYLMKNWQKHNNIAQNVKIINLQKK